MRRLPSLIIALLLTAAFTFGCGRQNSDNSSPAPANVGAAGAAGAPFKVALITSGSVSDHGWNAGAMDALQEIRTELKLSPEDSPNVENAGTPDKREENMRGFASKGFNIVFCHGAEFQEQALKMEGDFPKTLFVVSSGDKVGKNTTPIIFQLEDGAYLEGMLAAGMSKSGTIASVGASKDAPLQSIFNAFAAGAKAVNPNVKVIPTVYTQDWEDVGKAKQATEALIQQGADVIIQDLDAAAQGVFNAVEANKDKGVFALGTNSDQNSVAPDVILASAPIHIDKAFLPIAKGVRAGTFKPNATPFGMKEGVIDFVYNPALESKLPAPLKQKIDGAKAKILDGSFVVPKGG